MAQLLRELAGSAIMRTGSQHPYYKWVIPVSNCKPRSDGMRQEASCGTLASNPAENEIQVQGETTTKRKRGESDRGGHLAPSSGFCVHVHMRTHAYIKNKNMRGEELYILSGAIDLFPWDAHWSLPQRRMPALSSGKGNTIFTQSIVSVHLAAETSFQPNWDSHLQGWVQAHEKKPGSAASFHCCPVRHHFKFLSFSFLS